MDDILTWDEKLFLEWVRGLSEQEQDALDAAVEGDLSQLPLTLFQSYPHELLYISTPVGG